MSILILMLMHSCTPSEFSEIAQKMMQTIGAEQCNLSIENFVNTEGSDTKKLKLEFVGVPDEQISNEQSSLSFLEQTALSFYHNVKDKSELESYDGVNVIITSKNGRKVNLYLQLQEIEKVYEQMSLLESVIDEIVRTHKVDWANNLFHQDLNDLFKTDMDQFIMEKLDDLGSIQGYYIVRYKILNTQNQKLSIIRYACETEKKVKFYMDFMFDYNTNQILGLFAHDGSKEFDFSE